MFDIVNPEEVLQGGQPSLVEKGPYTYRATLEKFNITFNTNRTVTYRQRQTFVFDRDRSVGWDNDTFTTVSAPLFTVGTLLQYQYPFLKDAVNVLLEGLEEKALIKVSVHDIFWGYPDPFLKLVKEVFDKLHLHNDLITGVFGYYMGKNATDDGLYTAFTGTDDLAKFLLVNYWNREHSLSYWSTKQANMLNGTDGSLFPPFVTKDRIVQYFDSNVFRSISMNFKEDSNVRGIPTLKFVVEDKEFANATINPANAGFCTPRDHCIPSGLLNCSAMGHGAPLYVSLPHFLGADPYYFNLVEGLHPDRQKHQPFFHLHAMTGVCLSAGRRYQLNIQMKEYPFLSKTNGLKLSYVPVLWINGQAEIDDRIKNLFQDQIESPLAAVNDFHYAMFGIGPAMMLIPLVILIRHKRRAKKKRTSNTNGHTVQNGTTTIAGETNGHTVRNGTTTIPDETSPLISNSDERDN
ncbi:lysosome membrane protein 2-like isoform X3 [Littorina saxatilis]